MPTALYRMHTFHCSPEVYAFKTSAGCFETKDRSDNISRNKHERATPIATEAKRPGGGSSRRFGPGEQCEGTASRVLMSWRTSQHPVLSPSQHWCTTIARWSTAAMPEKLVAVTSMWQSILFQHRPQETLMPCACLRRPIRSAALSPVSPCWRRAPGSPSRRSSPRRPRRDLTCAPNLTQERHVGVAGLRATS